MSQTVPTKHKQKINTAQKHKLLHLLASKPVLRAGKFSATFSHKDAQRQWEQIAETVNAIPGARKPWKAWRKTWQDLLSKTKAKRATISKIRKRSGCGLPPEEELHEFEDGVAALLHPHAIARHSQSVESAVICDSFVEILVEPHQPPQRIDEQMIKDEILEPGQLQINDEENDTIDAEAEVSELLGQQQQRNANNDKTKRKTNMKTLLREKVKLKRETLKEKKQYNREKLQIKRESLEEIKKFNEVYLSKLERQTTAIEDISREVLHFTNNFTIE